MTRLYADAEDYKKMTDKQLLKEWRRVNGLKAKSFLDTTFLTFAKGAIRGELLKKNLFKEEK